MRGTVEAICRSAALTPPIICTPDELPLRRLDMKRRDAIIDDLHKVRQAIGRAHDFDVDRIAATVRRHEDEGRPHVIRELPKRTARRKKAS